MLAVLNGAGRGVLPVLVLLTAGQLRGQLVRDWSQVRTANFELLSRYDPSKTGPLLLELEWARSVLETNLQFKPEPGRKVLVLVPDSPFEYEQVSPMKFSGGYYMGAPWRDVIVLRELLDARHALLHEYTHLMLHHQAGQWPVWFDEGMAELYATMRRVNNSVEVGQPDSDRIGILRKGAWVPIGNLISLASSAEMPSHDALQRFYAQSWLCVHLLNFAPAYKDRFPRFRQLISEGVGTEDALKQVYSKTAIQFDNDARDWFVQKRFPVGAYRDSSPDSAKVDVKKVSQLDYDIARATVGAVVSKQSASQYASLARSAAGQCDLQPALGDLAFAGQQFSEASTHYQEAIKCGADAKGLNSGLELALSYRKDIPQQELETITAVTGSSLSTYLMGRNRYFTEDYEGTLQEFAKIKQLPQPQEFQMNRIRSLALARLGRFTQAEEGAKKLVEMASDFEQRQSAQLTVEDVQRARKAAETPPEPAHKAFLKNLQRIDGEVTRVDCAASGPRFWVRSGGETKKLIIADPSEVVTGPDENTQLEFSCGEQRRQVTIGYQEKLDNATGTVGRIRYIEFR